MDLGLKGRVALVTAAWRGLGRGTAEVREAAPHMRTAGRGRFCLIASSCGAALQVDNAATTALS